MNQNIKYKPQLSSIFCLIFILLLLFIITVPAVSAEEAERPIAGASCNPTDVYVGEVVECSGSSIGSEPVRYIWESSDGRVKAGEELDRVNFTFTEPGAHEIDFTIEDAQGETSSVTLEITVSPVSESIDHYVDINCLPSYPSVGETVECSVNMPPIYDIESAYWRFGDNTRMYTNSEENVEYEYEDQGLYTVKYTLEDSLGRGRTAETTVNVEPPENREKPDIYCSPNAITVGERVTCGVKEEDSDSINWPTADALSWGFGDNSSKRVYSPRNVSHVYDQPGEYNVRFVVDPGEGVLVSETTVNVEEKSSFSAVSVFTTSGVGVVLLILLWYINFPRYSRIQSIFSSTTESEESDMERENPLDRIQEHEKTADDINIETPDRTKDNE